MSEEKTSVGSSERAAGNRPGQAQHGRRVAAAGLRFLMQSRLDWTELDRTGQGSKSKAAPRSRLWSPGSTCAAVCGADVGAVEGGCCLGSECGETFLSRAIEKSPLLGSYLIQVRGTRGGLQVSAMYLALGEFSGLLAPITAAGQVFTGRQAVQQ